MVKSGRMIGIHLNDNGITNKIETLVEVLDIFDLKLADVSSRRLALLDLE